MKKINKILAVCLLLAVVVLIAAVGPFTGFFGSGQFESRTQTLDVQLNNDARLGLSLNIPEESFQLVAFKVSGEIEGEGNAKIYLNSSEGKYLVFDSDRLGKESGEAVSGFATDEADVVSSEEPSFEESVEEDSGGLESDAGAQKKGLDAGESGVEEDVSEEGDSSGDVVEDAGSLGDVSADGSEENSVEKAVSEESEQSSNESSEAGISGESANREEEIVSSNISIDEVEAESEDNISVDSLESGSNDSKTAEPAGEAMEAVDVTGLEPKVIVGEGRGFDSSCLETCLINDVFNESEYELLVEIEGDASIRIDSIEYSYSVLLKENESLQGNFSLIGDVPMVRINSGGVAQLDLANYFMGAERYELIISNISAEFDGDILLLRPDPEFKGARLGKITAYSGNASIESNEFNVLVSFGQIKIGTSRSKIKVGEKVKWIKNVSLDIPEDVTIELPDEAENVTVKKKEGEAEREAVARVNRITGAVVYASGREGKFSLFEWLKSPSLTGFVVGDILANESNSSKQKVEVVLQDNATEYTIEYETEAPEAFEENTSSGKKVIISGPDDLNYTDVLSFSTIPEVLEVGQESVIKIYWTENGSYVPFDAYDLSGNGMLDYVEWITPHLSNQTFEIILITNAEHLDENRTFVEDVYELVKERDGNWTDPIPAGHYVRATFERNLTSDKDITIYARSSKSGSVEVYEKDSDVKIADFGVISADKKYRVLLNGLAGEQDVFDLKVAGGSVEFDYIIDPNSPPNISNVNLASSSGTNLTGENLTVTFDVSDADNDTVKNITNWYKNGVSLTVLNMPFDGGSNGTYTKDYSGYGNSIFVNGSSWNSIGGYGGFGAYELDGVSGNIIAYNSTSLSFNKSQGTIIMWVYLNSLRGVNQNLLGDSEQEIEFAISSTGKLFFYPWEDVGVWNNYLMASSAISTGSWTHVAVTWDQTEKNASIYYNGIEQGLSTNNLASYWNQTAYTGDWVFGVKPSAQNRVWNGSIDEILVFDYPLTKEQIYALYNNRTDLIVSQETAIGEAWYAKVTPNDGTTDGTEVQSNNLSVVSNNAPIINSVNLTHSFAYSNETIGCEFNVTDSDAGDVLNVNVSWYLDTGSGFSYWGLDNETITASSGALNRTSNIGELEPSDITHLDSWKCEVVVTDGGSILRSNSSVLNISNYATSLLVVNDTGKSVDEQVVFTANFTKDGGFGVVGFDSGIGRRIWNSSNFSAVNTYSLAVFDYDSDGKRDEILLGTGEALRAFESNGTLVWTATEPGGWWINAIRVADVDGDSSDDIFLVDASGRVMRFDRTGTQVWQSADFGTGRAIELMDINQDGNAFESVAAFNNNVADTLIVAFNESGAQQWNVTLSQTIKGVREMKAADIDNDGKKDEIILATQNASQTTHTLYVLDHTGAVMFTSASVNNGLSAVDVGDVDGDGKNDVVFAGFDYVRALNGSGSVIYTKTGSDYGEINELIIDDINEDGTNEIIVGSDLYDGGAYIRILDNNANLALWNYSLPVDDEIYSLDIADINDDRKKEVVAGGDSGILWVLDRDGGLIFEENISMGTIGNPGEFGFSEATEEADVNGDGIFDVAVALDDEVLFVFQTGNCSIDFDDGVSGSMSWNHTSRLWDYNRSFSTQGDKGYNVTCSKGGYDNGFQSLSVNVASDIPSSVSGLANQSLLSDDTWIYWNWTNPSDSDFDVNVIYLDGIWKSNTSNNYYNATGLSVNTSYTITVHTKDTSGNVNDTDVNDTATTDAGRTTLVINYTKNPVEVLDSFNITANFSDSDGNVITGASCVLNEEPNKFVMGIGGLSTSQNLLNNHNEVPGIYENRTIRIDFTGIPQNMSDYDVIIRAHRHNLTADDLRAYVRCDGNYTIDSAYKIGTLNTSDGVLNPEVGAYVFLFNNSFITGSSCSVLLESNGSTSSDKGWMVRDVNSTLNTNNSYNSSDFGESYALRATNFFVDFGYSLSNATQKTLSYNSISGLYELNGVHHSSAGTFVDSVNCSAVNYLSASDNETLTVQDNAAPLVQINEITPNPSELNVDNLTIYWAANDFELDTRIINVTYPNGSLLTQGAISPLELSVAQLSVEGVYSIYAWANDSAGLVSNVSSNFSVLDFSPSISFGASTENSSFVINISKIQINVTASDSNLANITIYLFNSSNGLVNQTTSTTSPNFVNISVSSNGVYFFNATAFDTGGNSNSTGTRNVTISDSAPSLSLVSPANQTYTSRITVLNYTVSDDNLNSCWYSPDSGASNISVACGSNVTGLSSSEGSNRWTVYANDTAGNENSSSVTFFVDTIAPNLTLTEPTGTKTSRTGIDLTFSVADANLDSCLYNVYRGGSVEVSNTTVVCGSGSGVFNVTLDADFTLNFYANDTAGNLNSSSSGFTVDTTVTPESSGGSSGGSGGSGGGSSIVTSSEKGLNLDITGLEDLGFRRDMEKNVTVGVTSNHFKFLNNCTAKVTGFLEDWFSNDEVKGISRGERVEYVMKLKVPVSISFGDYTSDFVLSCDEGLKSEEFNLTVYENGLYGEILNYEKGAGNKLSISYGMQEFDGVDREVKVIYKIVDLDGIVVLEGSEEKFLAGEERKELSFEVNLPRSTFGEFDLIMEFNDGNFVKSVKKRIFLPSTGGITGLALSEEQKKVLSVIGVILFAVFMLFLVIKFIYKHNKIVRRHHKSKRRLIELDL